MLNEGSGAMDKKLQLRSSPVQPKNNGVIAEKKSDYGRPRRQREPGSNGGKSQELSQNSRQIPRSNRNFSDKRPRPRDSFNDRQSEEVAEVVDIFDVTNTSSRKGNANHLLKFSYGTRSELGNYDNWRYNGGRSGNGRRFFKKTPAVRYSKEQFLQASCQFVVREDGEYTEQAIDPDALVNWDKVELVRTFSTETVTCPICLQVPFAGKITKCGHTYCWACILHHLDEADNGGQNKCPVCPNRISPDELRSVQCIEVPEYKVGDEIEMRLMRKSKGSVYTSPKANWRERCGIPHNINDGDVTNFMKLLLATKDQVQNQVIDLEKASLAAHLLDAEDYEVCYIDMAKNMLEKRENKLKATVSFDTSTIDIEKSATIPDSTPLAAGISFDGTKIAIQYADAFENVEQQTTTEESTNTETPDPSDPLTPKAFSDKGPNSETIKPELSSLPLSQGIDNSQLLTPEEAADYLELPESGNAVQQNVMNRSKDTYYFYQASTGQQIYLNSLNAQCLTKEYGSLENSPEVIKASIVAIERIFMTEDIRKRLRYLNHIPLTCEFHVVELKILPPIISKSTLRHFQPEFEKRRRARQKKQKDDKMRAKQQEVEHKKSFGIFPEVEIPLDNLTQFPSPLSSYHSEEVLSSPAAVGGVTRPQVDETCGGEIKPGAGPWGNRTRTDSEGSQTGSGTMSFAAMLKEGKSVPQTSVWGRGSSQHSPTLTSSVTMPELRSPTGHYGIIDEDEDAEYLPAPPIAASWFDDISRAMDAHIVERHSKEDGPSPSSSGGKKKKKKEKQLLFSTTMARKK